MVITIIIIALLLRLFLPARGDLVSMDGAAPLLREGSVGGGKEVLY